MCQEQLMKSKEENMNKLILEGKEYTLSDELVEKIKAEVTTQEEKISFFTRKHKEEYFYINYDGNIQTTTENRFSIDDRIFSIGNYCRNKELIEQRALGEILNRLLWRYSIEHDGVIVSYGIDMLWRIDYSVVNHDFCLVWTSTNITNGVVYFKKEETAQKAIKEVIKPFLENHPEFDYFNW